MFSLDLFSQRYHDLSFSKTDVNSWNVLIFISNFHKSKKHRQEKANNKPSKIIHIVLLCLFLVCQWNSVSIVLPTRLFEKIRWVWGTRRDDTVRLVTRSRQRLTWHTSTVQGGINQVDLTKHFKTRKENIYKMLTNNVRG